MTEPTLRWQCICVDAADPGTIASFWEQALGWRRTHDDGDEVVLEPPEGSPQDGVSPDILFLRVPEGKTVKNRLHLDLRPDEQAAEVARLIRLGATYADVGQPADASFTVLRDPEGNELCVLRALSDAETS
jgi:hypothetical protein